MRLGPLQTAHSPSKLRQQPKVQSSAVPSATLHGSHPGLGSSEAQVPAAARPAPGDLRLIVGPMFAGKTTALLEAVHDAEMSNKQAIVVTSALDNRYGTSLCASHDGYSRPAVAVQELLPLLDPHKTPVDMNGIDIIAVDESQFFPDLKVFCLKAVEDLGKTVVVAGLNGDFQRNTFGDMTELMPYADSVLMLQARCTFCDQPAPFTLRLVADHDQRLVGGKDAYQPVCRGHYCSLSQQVPCEKQDPAISDVALMHM